MIGPERSNWWVSLNAQFIKCAPQQLRLASPEELAGVDAVDEILKGFTAKSAAEEGLIDITAQEFPPEAVPGDAVPLDSVEDPASSLDMAAAADPAAAVPAVSKHVSRLPGVSVLASADARWHKYPAIQ